MLNWSSTKPYRKGAKLAWPCWLCCCTKQFDTTHQWISVPELILSFWQNVRLVMDEASLSVRSILQHTPTTQSCVKPPWKCHLSSASNPHLVPIIEELTAVVRAEYKDPASFIDENDRVHMAHMDIHYGCYSVNVAALHTEILKNSWSWRPLIRYFTLKNPTTKQTITRRFGLRTKPQTLSHYFDDILMIWQHHDASKLKTFFSYEDKDAVKAKLGNIKSHQQTEIGSSFLERPSRCGNQSKFALWFKSNVFTNTNVNKWTLCMWSTNTWDTPTSLLAQSPFSR